MKVNIDEDWKYITTLSHTTGGSKLFVANWLSGVTIYTPEIMKIKTLSIYRDFIFLGMEYGAVIRQNLKDLKGLILGKVNLETLFENMVSTSKYKC